MFSSLSSTFSILVRLAFAIPVLIVLLRLYTRTRMKAFLWLVASLVAWPLLAVGTSIALPFFLRHLAASGGYGSSPVIAVYGLVFLVEALLGGALLLVSVIVLERELIARMDPRPSAPPPPFTPVV